MIDALSRIKGLVEVKKNAINLGVNLGQLPNNEVLEIPELLTIEHNILRMYALLCLTVSKRD